MGYVLERCGLGPGSVLVDVGCGTGISSRLFAAHGLRVIGIEPNDEGRGTPHEPERERIRRSVTMRSSAWTVTTVTFPEVP